MSLNQTELKNLIRRVLGGKWKQTCLKDIGEHVYPRFKYSNEVIHRQFIQDMIDDVKDKYYDYRIISSVSIRNKPIIDIYVDICHDYNNVKFRIYGLDLRNHCSFIPNMLFTNSSGKTIFGKPLYRKKSNYYEYPPYMEEKMIDVALGLRLLNIYLKKVKITNDFTKQDTGLLGYEVKIDIPSIFKDYVQKYDTALHNPLLRNCEKIGDGLFLFRKYFDYDYINEYLERLSEIFPIFKKVLTNYSLSKIKEFIDSEYSFAIFDLQHQYKTIFKHKDGSKITVYIIEPRPFNHSDEYIFKELDIEVNLVKRKRKDQVNGEHISFYYCFARTIQMMMNKKPLKCVEEPLTDVSAYLTDITA